MPQNFVVTRYQHGGYPRGSVLPRYAVAAAAGSPRPNEPEAAYQARVAAVIAELIERGVIAPTDAPVNVDIAPPVARGAAALPSGLTDETASEINKLRKDVADLTMDRDQHASRADLAVAARQAMSAEIAEFVVENSHLRKACEEHQSRIDELGRAKKKDAERIEELLAENAALKADMEKATAPRGTRKTASVA